MADCPISSDDSADGWNVPEFEDYCNETAALTQYCLPSINATVPPSTSFPVTCSPSYWVSLAESTTTITTTSPSRPEQTGIAANCDAFYFVQSNDTCQDIVNQFGNFTLAQFYGWNPAVGTSCQYLNPHFAVCIGVLGGTPTTSTSTSTVPSPLEPSTDPQCTSFHLVVKGDSCSEIETEYKITADQFNSWNPHVGANCLYLDLNEYVCVGAPPVTGTTTTTASSTTPSPLEPSTISTCTKYHLVVKGDSCAALEATHAITAAQFNLWNPHVGTNCLYLDLNEYICVGAPS